MEGRVANTGRLTLNEVKFIESALHAELRADGRGLYDYRELTIKFGKEYGSTEVQLGQTLVVGFVSAQLVQPFRDRPNDGTITIFTEFSPMADPSFEFGRPRESAVELGRIIDRGLRESRAVDTESLCVLAGKLVWAVRIDLHVLDNGGNLVDAANIAALAALLTFRRPECTLGGEDGLQVKMHSPEERVPLPLIMHHLPIVYTFGFFNNGNILIMDPTHAEEAVMVGRMMITINANGDVCGIQKAGEVGVMQSVIVQCLRLASSRVACTTKQIKDAVEAYNNDIFLRKIKSHSSEKSEPVDVLEEKGQLEVQENVSKFSRMYMERLKLECEEKVIQSTEVEIKNCSKLGQVVEKISLPLRWDPYSEGVDIDLLKASLASRGPTLASARYQKQTGWKHGEKAMKTKPQDLYSIYGRDSELNVAIRGREGKEGVRTLKDAVKPKNQRKDKLSYRSDTI